MAIKIQSMGMPPRSSGRTVAGIAVRTSLHREGGPGQGGKGGCRAGAAAISQPGSGEPHCQPCRPPAARHGLQIATAGCLPQSVAPSRIVPGSLGFPFPSARRRVGPLVLLAKGGAGSGHGSTIVVVGEATPPRPGRDTLTSWRAFVYAPFTGRFVDSASPSGTLADRPWNLAVLISGSGRTLANLLAAIDRGDLDARISVVVSSVPGVRGLDIAAAAGIPAFVVQRRSYASLAEYSEGIYAAVRPFAPDLLIMAGFLRKMLVFPGWEGRILNIHPALLPEASAYAAGKGKFGDRVHAAVLENGDLITGVTVHLVTDEYDAGPSLARAEVPVHEGDTPATLAARVFAAEIETYPAAIQRYMADNPMLKRTPSSGVSH